MGKKRVPRARGAPRTKPRPARSRSSAAADGSSTRLTVWLTRAAYARHRGGSKEAVSKAIRQGRIPVGSDGRVDRAVADLAWDRNTSPSRAGAPQASGPPPVDLTEARTMHEYAKAQLAELELGERQ